MARRLYCTSPPDSRLNVAHKPQDFDVNPASSQTRRLPIAKIFAPSRHTRSDAHRYDRNLSTALNALATLSCPTETACCVGWTDRNLFNEPVPRICHLRWSHRAY